MSFLSEAGENFRTTEVVAKSVVMVSYGLGEKTVHDPGR